ncbi:MAG: serine--tRNA ligase [Pseudomonadota bacterium]
MIDVKKLTENPEEYKKCLQDRGWETSYVDKIIALDAERRELLSGVEKLRADKKLKSQEFGKLKKEGKDTSELEKSIKEMDATMVTSEQRLSDVQAQCDQILLTTPNYLQADVPVGKDSSFNKVVREWGKKPEFNFKPKDHVDLGESLGIIDFKRAGKVTGARFVFMCGAGARLERAVINFMLDTHTKQHGYKEMFPPFIVNDNSLMGTGQLPKFKDDLFKLENFPFYLIPTAEVPVTNFYADEILEHKSLPIKFAAFSACFRSEAGSYGKDTRGMIRQHEFNKVELVKITDQQSSFAEHEALTKDAEKILQLLGLHYRVVTLSSGDTGFAASKCYDLEVWLPADACYREISSCSNFLDFQARRAKIRYRDPQTGKPVLAHTINGSGLAVGRTVIAILENYQQADGTIIIPEVLRPYMDTDKISKD